MDEEKKEKLFEEAKKACGLTTYHDDKVRPIFEDILCYLEDAGVSDTVLNSGRADGTIVHGVSDLYFEQGLSGYFKERVIQLSMTEEE